MNRRTFFAILASAIASPFSRKVTPKDFPYRTIDWNAAIGPKITGVAHAQSYAATLKSFSAGAMTINEMREAAK